MTRKKEEKIR